MDPKERRAGGREGEKRERERGREGGGEKEGREREGREKMKILGKGAHNSLGLLLARS